MTSLQTFRKEFCYCDFIRSVKYKVVLLIFSLPAFINCKGTKCNIFLLTGDNCNKKYYWGYIPYAKNTPWSWYYCTAKKNWSKLPDYAFIQYGINPDGTLAAFKGGIDGNSYGPFDQRFGNTNVQVKLIKVGTFKQVKDDPTAFKNWATYYTPYEMFDYEYESEYAFVNEEAKRAVLNGTCTSSYIQDCVSDDTKDKVSNFCGLFTSKPKSKPGALSTGSSTIVGSCTDESRFNNAIIKQWVPFPFLNYTPTIIRCILKTRPLKIILEVPIEIIL
jgi:hypothetical protein